MSDEKIDEASTTTAIIENGDKQDESSDGEVIDDEELEDEKTPIIDLPRKNLKNFRARHDNSDSDGPGSDGETDKTKGITDGELRKLKTRMNGVQMLDKNVLENYRDKIINELEKKSDRDKERKDSDRRKSNSKSRSNSFQNGFRINRDRDRRNDRRIGNRMSFSDRNRNNRKRENGMSRPAAADELRVIGIKRALYFPLSIVKHTKTKPSISYSERPQPKPGQVNKTGDRSNTKSSKTKNTDEPKKEKDLKKEKKSSKKHESKDKEKISPKKSEKSAESSKSSQSSPKKTPGKVNDKDSIKEKERKSKDSDKERKNEKIEKSEKMEKSEKSEKIEKLEKISPEKQKSEKNSSEKQKIDEEKRKSEKFSPEKLKSEKFSPEKHKFQKPEKSKISLEKPKTFLEKSRISLEKSEVFREKSKVSLDKSKITPEKSKNFLENSKIFPENSSEDQKSPNLDIEKIAKSPEKPFKPAERIKVELKLEKKKSPRRIEKPKVNIFLEDSDEVDEFESAIVEVKSKWSSPSPEKPPKMVSPPVQSKFINIPMVVESPEKSPLISLTDSIFDIPKSLPIGKSPTPSPPPKPTKVRNVCSFLSDIASGNMFAGLGLGSGLYDDPITDSLKTSKSDVKSKIEVESMEPDTTVIKSNFVGSITPSDGDSDSSDESESESSSDSDDTTSESDETSDDSSDDDIPAFSGFGRFDASSMPMVTQIKPAGTPTEALSVLPTPTRFQPHQSVIKPPELVTNVTKPAFYTPQSASTPPTPFSVGLGTMSFPIPFKIYSLREAPNCEIMFPSPAVQTVKTTASDKKDLEKEKEKERDRESIREKERDKEKEKDREKESVREKERDREKEREKERERDREKEIVREKDRDREKESIRERDREKESIRERDREKESIRERDREKEREKDKEKEREKEKDRKDFDKEKERKERDRKRSRSRSRSHERDRKRLKDDRRKTPPRSRPRVVVEERKDPRRKDPSPRHNSHSSRSSHVSRQSPTRRPKRSRSRTPPRHRLSPRPRTPPRQKSPPLKTRRSSPIRRSLSRSPKHRRSLSPINRRLRSQSPLSRRSPRRRLSRSPRRRLSPDYRYERRSISPSFNKTDSPHGYRMDQIRPDSTISDTELERQQFLQDEFYMSQWNNSQSSPKRPNLDDRIHRILSDSPSRNPPHDYPPDAYPYPYHDNRNGMFYHDMYPPAPNQHDGYDYQNEFASPRNFVNNSNLVDITQQNRDRQRAGNSQAVQVGNVLEIVPSNKIVVPESKDPNKSKTLSPSELKQQAERRVQAKLKRKINRERKRAEKQTRKEKLRLEIQRYFDAGVTVDVSDDENLIPLRTVNIAATAEKSILRRSKQPATTEKKVLFSDGILPGETTTEDDMNESVVESLAMKRRRKKYRKNRLVKAAKAQEVNEVKESDTGPIDMEIEGIPPPPPPADKPPAHLKQPQLKKITVEMFAAFPVNPDPLYYYIHKIQQAKSMYQAQQPPQPPRPNDRFHYYKTQPPIVNQSPNYPQPPRSLNNSVSSLDPRIRSAEKSFT